MSLLNTKVRALAAGVATGALLGGALVTMAPAANAAAQTVTNPSASWGVKESWRGYVGSQGTITVSEGAGSTPAYTWPAAGTASTFDVGTNAGTIRLKGKVAFTYPEHFMNLTVSNPTVVLDGDGTGDLYLDVDYDYTGSGMPVTPIADSADQVHFATLSGVPAPTYSSSAQATISRITTTLTSNGKRAFANFYDATPVVDPLTLRFGVNGVPTVTKLAVSPTQVAYGKASTAKVTVTGAASGRVTLLDGSKSLGTKAIAGGAASFTLPKNLKVGAHTLTAKFTGTGEALPSQSAVRLTVVKAKANATAKFSKAQLKKAKAGKRAKLTVKVTASGLTPTGKVTVRDGKKKLTTVKLKKGKASIKLPKLKKGKRKLTVTYNGSSTIAKDTSKKLTVKVKK